MTIELLHRITFTPKELGVRNLTTLPFLRGLTAMIGTAPISLTAWMFSKEW
jgi:hypothetical protein